METRFRWLISQQTISWLIIRRWRTSLKIQKIKFFKFQRKTKKKINAIAEDDFVETLVDSDDLSDDEKST